METIMNFMTNDHDRLDSLFKQFQDFKNNDAKKAINLFHEFKIGLQRHIVWEEEILFPLFENKTGMYSTGPTAVMRMEHRRIKDFLEKIHNNLIKGDDASNDLENGLITILTDHNNKEESILYPWIDNSASEKEKEDVFKSMKNISPEKYNKCCES